MSLIDMYPSRLYLKGVVLVNNGGVEVEVIFSWFGSSATQHPIFSSIFVTQLSTRCVNLFCFPVWSAIFSAARGRRLWSADLHFLLDHYLHCSIVQSFFFTR